MNRRDFLKMLGAAGVGTVSLPARAAGFATRPAIPVLGINSHLLTPEAIAQLRDLRIRDVRTTVLWPRWQRNDLGYRDAVRENFDRAGDAGLRVIAVCHNVVDGRIFHSAADRGEWDRYADWIAGMALRFPAIDGWQLWNEQDVWVQAPFGAGRGLDAETCGRNYAEQLRLAHPRIRQANPRTRVISGGTADHPSGRWRGFLRGMAESRPPVDVVAVHAYGPWERTRGMLLEARETVGGAATIWLTECGNDRPHAFDPRRQLDIWRGVVEGNERERLAERVYPYCLQTDPNDPGHGLFEVGGAPRPVYGWLRDHGRAGR